MSFQAILTILISSLYATDSFSRSSCPVFIDREDSHQVSWWLSYKAFIYHVVSLKMIIMCVVAETLRGRLYLERFRSLVDRYRLHVISGFHVPLV